MVSRLGQLQIRNLRKIRAFVKNTALRDERQSGIREQCLNLWEVSVLEKQSSYGTLMHRRYLTNLDNGQGD